MKKLTTAILVALLVCSALAPACSLAAEAPAAAQADTSALSATGETAWQNAPNIGDVTAGEALVLEPVDYAKVTIQNSANRHFPFTCTPAGTAKPAFKCSFVISYSNGYGSVLQTITYGKVITWEADQTQADVDILFTTDMTLSGNDYLYFYLVDENDVCISNIVMWDVSFE